MWDCYSGYLNLKLNVNNTMYQAVVYTNTGAVTKEKTIENMEKNYPLGENLDCWYDPANPTNVRLEITSGSIYVGLLVTAVVIVAIATLFMALKCRK